MVEIYERRLPLIIWGDGGQARLADIRPPELNRLGIDIIKVLFEPTKELMQREDLTEEDLTHEKRAMWKSYPRDMFEWLDQSPRDAILLILCNFKGEKTGLTGLTKGFIELLIGRRQMENNLKVQIAGLRNDLRMATTEKIEIEKQFNEIRKMMESKKDDEEKN